MEQNRNDVLSAAFNKARNMIQKDSANNIGNSLGNISSVFDTVTNTPSYSMNESTEYDYEEPSYVQPINGFGITFVASRAPPKPTSNTTYSTCFK